MQLTIGPPLLFAIGVRILLNLLDTTRSPSIPDFFLIGIWQGVLIHYSLRQLSWLVYPVAFGITAKLLYDYVEKADPSRCACTLFGIAVGVLLTDLLVQVLENGRYDEREPPPTPQPSRTPYEPPRRTRLVSFDRSAYNGERRRDKERRRRTPSPERARARTLAASPAPTAHTAAPTSYTIDSVPSSIDPDNKLTPTEREIAVLRARASLADSERRRYKEERKWALSQGNHARADQLAFHVKRYTTLMESFHKEADNKVVEAAQVAHKDKSSSRTQPQAGPSQYNNAVAGPSRISQSNIQRPEAGPSNGHANGAPLVSVTVGTPAPGGRSRKRSGGLKSAIYVHNG